MPIDTIGLVLGKTVAENHGVPPPESTRIGIASSLFGNPVTALVAASALADKVPKPEEPAAPGSPPLVVAGPRTDPAPPDPNVPGGGTPPTQRSVEEVVKEAVQPLANQIQELKKTTEQLAERIARLEAKPPDPHHPGEGPRQTRR